VRPGTAQMVHSANFHSVESIHGMQAMQNISVRSVQVFLFLLTKSFKIGINTSKIADCKFLNVVLIKMPAVRLVKCSDYVATRHINL